MFNELIDLFRNKKSTSTHTLPLENLTATHKWVDQLQQLHEYEAHQEVVSLLDSYNRSTTSFDVQRLHILGVIEHVGSKLQHGLITQFLKNHADFKYAGKSLWQEVVAFYWQLAQAYQSMTTEAMNHSHAAGSALPTLVLRALHYQGKLIQWRYLRYELPTPHTWHALHKLYKVAEQHGFAKKSMVLKGSAFCSCEQAYTRILLLHLMRPVGLSPSEIELAAYWAWKWRDNMTLAKKFDASKHDHYIALSDSLPPQSVNQQALALESVRYWSVNGIIANTEGLHAVSSNHSKLIKLYGVPFANSPENLLQHIHTKLTTTVSISETAEAETPTAMNVGCGEKIILNALRNPASSQHIMAQYQATGHPGEAYYRLKLKADNSACKVKAHDLLVSYSDNLSQIQTLAVVRWLEESTSPNITLGMERLSSKPCLVQLHALQDSVASSPVMPPELDVDFNAIIDTSADTLASFKKLTHKYYNMRDGDYVFCIRIDQYLERKPKWSLVRFSRLSRRFDPR